MICFDFYVFQMLQDWISFYEVAHLISILAKNMPIINYVSKTFTVRSNVLIQDKPQENFHLLNGM